MARALLYRILIPLEGWLLKREFPQGIFFVNRDGPMWPCGSRRRVWAWVRWPVSQVTRRLEGQRG